VLNAGYRSSVSASTGDLSPELAHRVEEGIGSAYAAAGELGPQGPQVLDGARHALVDGWQLSMWVGVAMAAAVFLFLAVRGPARRSAEQALPEVDETAVGEPVLVGALAD
jgi:hypothetical protein